MGEGFQFLDIIFFAMIAVFLVMRLRSVLGRRTGHERQRDLFNGRRAEEMKKEKGDKVVPLPDRNRPAPPEGVAPSPTVEAGASPLQAGVAQIQAVDQSFDPNGFTAGARAAFEMIVGAYAAGDTTTLRPLLSDEVFENFSTAITERTKANETLETTLVGITSADIIEAELQGRMALVTVKFVSEQINVTRDSEGRILDGDPSHVATVTDIWTFARNTRSRDPNWALIATSSPN
ncbi:Tim44/TimA family putative adaptor protein [Rhodospirillaceae bacterium SYSU D60014]|uniref:Tim44/TimA family putative adaptor protein n=1 Tax=Virgifigura deserti TaxID=2268457 RepID=UPI000E67192A